MELTAVVEEKNPRFDLNELSIIRTMRASHEKDLANKAGVCTMQVDTQKQKLESAEYSTLVSKVEYDVSCVQAYTVRVKDQQANAYHKRVQWRMQYIEKGREFANELMKNTVQCIEVDTIAPVLAHLTQNVKDLASKNFLPADTDVITIPVVNWTAQSVYSSKLQNIQASIMGCILSEHDAKGVGLVMMPTFAYKKGALHTHDTSAHAMLTSSNINTDQLCFGLRDLTSRTSSRDERPSVLRMVVAHGKDSSLSKTPFRTSTLVSTGHCNIGPFLNTADMVRYESIDPASLPEFTDEDGGVTGAYRHVQLGKEAWINIITALIDKASFSSSRICIRIVDCSPGVGDLLRAVVTYSVTSATIPVYYVGLTNDQEHEAFILEQLKEDVAASWLEGKITQVGSTSLKCEWFTNPARDI